MGGSSVSELSRPSLLVWSRLLPLPPLLLLAPLPPLPSLSSSPPSPPSSLRFSQVSSCPTIRGVSSLRSHFSIRVAGLSRSDLNQLGIPSGSAAVSRQNTQQQSLASTSYVGARAGRSMKWRSAPRKVSHRTHAGSPWYFSPHRQKGGLGLEGACHEASRSCSSLSGLVCSFRAKTKINVSRRSVTKKRPTIFPMTSSVVLKSSARQMAPPGYTSSERYAIPYATTRTPPTSWATSWATETASRQCLSADGTPVWMHGHVRPNSSSAS
mmetsp:Transcript_8724/g.19763  ORF Transcript_8724/g.19763 Transcript_8724/m.19763 type:complete len:268 (+) Transcript_8724:352-1155(+)